MTTALATTDNGKLYESLALKGDLSALTPQEKALYYGSLCERLGLDATTQPFTPLTMNGKQILYASRGCTDQLARIHHVNRQIVKEEEIRGAYIVTVEAMLPDGRREQSKGAVCIENLKGDAFCNAIMKAETKAKRRATLSILGLGMLDEVELETVPAYARETVQVVDAPTEPTEPIVEAEPEDRQEEDDEPPASPDSKLRWYAWKSEYSDMALLKWLRDRYSVDAKLGLTEAINSLGEGELEQAITLFKTHWEAKEAA